MDHNGASSHAYIFEGEKGLGCTQFRQTFCGGIDVQKYRCRTLRKLSELRKSKADTNPDIIYVRPKADKKSIGAKDMRKLEEDVAV